MEEWKDVVGYEGLYQVSNEGRVKSIFYRGKPRNHIRRCNRERIILSKDKQLCSFRIDYLVANAFLPKSDIMECVRHLNGDVTDNRVENLEWDSITLKQKNSIKCEKNARRDGNEWHIENGYVYFKLSNCDEYGICDISVWEELKKYRWAKFPTNYIFATINKKHIKFHQMVLPYKEGFYPDHINRNRLDNRIENLRYASYRANAINHSVRKDNKVGHTGIRLNSKGLYEAYIWVNKQVYLGKYKKLEEAILAREKAEEKYHKPIIEKETHT